MNHKRATPPMVFAKVAATAALSQVKGLIKIRGVSGYEAQLASPEPYKKGVALEQANANTNTGVVTLALAEPSKMQC